MSKMPPLPNGLVSIEPESSPSNASSIPALPNGLEPIGGATTTPQSSTGDLVKGLARSAAQGVSFGFSDEAEAWLRSKLGNDSYELNTARIRDEIDAFARAYAHWFYLIEPAPFPERMIGANPDEYWLKKCGSGAAGLTPFAPAALAEYLRCFRMPETIHATCEDYRAAASIDIRHDDEDDGKMVTCPMLALWGRYGVIQRCFDARALWRERAVDVIGDALPGGHYLAEELPERLARRLAGFMKGEIQWA